MEDDKRGMIGISVGLLIVGLVAGYALGKNRSENIAHQSPITSLAPIDITNWKTYRNISYGFEVQYPYLWHAYEPSIIYGGEGGKIIFKIAETSSTPEFLSFSPLDLTVADTSVDEGESISINKENGSYFLTDSKTVDDFWNKLGKYDGRKLVNKFQEKKNIDGVDVIFFQQYEWSATLGKDIWQPQALFMHKGSFFWVRPSEELSPGLFETLISTLKFTN